jgi:hypothetical protein
MADQRTTPAGEDNGGAPTRPFDRQALQATLADAVRIATTDSDSDEAPTPKPVRTPSPQDAIGSGPAPVDGRPRPPTPRPPNPFGRTAPAAPAPAAAPAAPAPVRPSPSLLGGGTPTGVGTGQGGSSLNPLTAPSSGGLGGLRSTTPDNLGPINFSGDRPPGDLNAGRTVSGLAPTPTNGPTIPLRRRAAAETSHSARSTEAAAPTAPAPAPQAAHPARTLVPVDAWMPGDDDILPRRQVKKSFRLVR